MANETDLSRVAELIRAGDLTEAQRALAGVPDSEESRGERRYLQGLLAEQQHDVAAALEWYEKALQADPDHLEAMFRAALIEDRLGDDKEALALLEQCVYGDEASVNAILNLAVLYEERGMFARARACIDAVLDELPEHRRAKYLRRSVAASSSMYIDEKSQRDREARAALFDTPISEFELSVRSRNCLKQMNIRTLGDLLRTTEAELLAYKNFGETSLHEIRDMLTAKGLKLGQLVLGGGEEPAPVEPEPEPAAVAPSLMMKPVAELELSIRSRKCLQRLGISTVGELASRSETELLEMKNFGQTSLSEIRRKLAQLGLHLRK